MHGGIAGGDIGIRSLKGGEGVVIVLLADGGFREEMLEAVLLKAGQGGGSLGAGETGLGTIKGCLIGRGVDLVERLPFLDIAALGEELL